MTLTRWIRNITGHRYFGETPGEYLARHIPSYRLACNNERVCRESGNTRGIGRSRKQKTEALHKALAGRT